MNLRNEILSEQKDPTAYAIRKSSDLFILKLKNDIIMNGKRDGNYLVGRMIFENDCKKDPPYFGERCPLEICQTSSKTKIFIPKRIFAIYEKLKYYAITENLELSKPYIFEAICEKSFYTNELIIPYKTYILGSSVCCTIEKDNVLCGRAEFRCAVDYRVDMRHLNE